MGLLTSVMGAFWSLMIIVKPSSHTGLQLFNTTFVFVFCNRTEKYTNQIFIRESDRYISKKFDLKSIINYINQNVINMIKSSI